MVPELTADSSPAEVLAAFRTHQVSCACGVSWPDASEREKERMVFSLLSASKCFMRDHDVLQVVLIKDACPGRGAAARHENFCAKYTELLQRGSLAEHSASPRSWYAC